MGDIGKGQVITAPDDYIDLLIKNNLAEPIETKPEPKAELETKPQPKKKAKVKK